jgi:hypothetical protein
MHEIRATIPADCVPEAARLAHSAGIARVVVSEVFVHGPDQERRVLSVETSTPKARAFVEAFLDSPTLPQADCSLTSREVRAIVDDQPLADLTVPMSEPFSDVIQDLWQLGHVTASYIARASAGAIPLATGIIEDNPIAIVVAALFLPFLAQVLAVSFGLWNRDRRLIVQSPRALIVSTVLAYSAGAIVGWVESGPVRFAGFKSPLSSFGISAVIGITAGLSNADDTGRRYLIGVAVAVQLAIFPVWLGAASVIGMPSHEVLYSRLLSFIVNFISIAGCAVVACAALHLSGGAGFLPEADLSWPSLCSFITLWTFVLPVDELDDFFSIAIESPAPSVD